MDAKEKCKEIGGVWKDNACVINKDVMDKLDYFEDYTLYGVVTVTSWMDNKMFARLIINTDRKGYEEIKKEPLQDYLYFGVKSVDFASFTPYVRKGLKKKEELPLIEKGKYNLTEKEEEFLMKTEPIVITY